MNEHAPPSAPGQLSGAVEGRFTPSSQAFDIVAGALHRVAACLEEIGPKQNEAARLIRIGRLDDAFPQMAACVGMWQEVQSLLAAAADAVGQPVERLAGLVLTTTGEPEANPLTELAAALLSIKRTVQGRDWVGLSDALEYDLGELAQRWRSALVQPDETNAAATAGDSGMTRSAPAA